MVTLLRLAAPVLVLLFATVLPAAGAHAQAAAGQGTSSGDGEARALFEAGREAFDAARFEAAIDYFQQAFELSGRPQFHFNIASAADRARQDALALREYQLYLQEVPDAENRSYVEGRITTLRANAAATSPAEPSAPAEGGGDVTGEWWFWTLIGVLAVGAAVGITVGVVLGTAETEAPYQGSFGPGVVVTLVEGEF